MRFSLPAIILLILIGAAKATAQNVDGQSTPEPLRPVFSAYQLRGGSSRYADSYLSPLLYSGWAIGFDYQRIQAMKFDPENWVMQLRLGIEVDRGLNPSGNSSMLYGGVDASCAMMRRWRLPYNLSIGVGPAVSLNVGCFYLSRNGNNPASAKASLTLDASAYASWSVRLASLPVTFRYQAQLAAIGCFFSPDYGELYYEIYLGNHSGLAHCSWPGNYFKYEHLLSADLNFGSTSLRLGYQGEIHSTKANNLTTRFFTHSAVVGISGEWLSLDPRKKLSPDARIISATY